MESEGKGAFVHLLHFLKGLKANQGNDPLQSGYPTLTTLEVTPVFITFPGSDSEMVLQVQKLFIIFCQQGLYSCHLQKG